MKSESIVNDLIRISSEIEFFSKLYNFAVVDPSNEFIHQMDSIAVKIHVLLFKNKWENGELEKIFDLYNQFHVLMFQLYLSLRKE